MSLMGSYCKAALLIVAVLCVDVRLALAKPLDEFYIQEFLRLSEDNQIWQSLDFINQLTDEIEQLKYDGLFPEHYQIDADADRIAIVRQYFLALSDLHYGLTFASEVEPYLTYPSERAERHQDTSRILNFALAAMENPKEAFALARPDSKRYQRLRDAYQLALWCEDMGQDKQLSIQINLERLRQISRMMSDNMVLVDIVGAELTVFDNGEVILNQPSQVGRTDRQTPLMWSEITHITVNPSWTVPPTVYRDDMLPQIRQNISFLEDNQIQVLDFDGHPLNPRSINWRNPGRILLRQKPGELNELGRIVVRFPNNEAIFLHDTPSQGYFSKQMRALSSGCIRLQEAPRLAEILLELSQTDQVDRLPELLNNGRTQEIFFDHKIPVLLAYWTVDANDQGNIEVRPDLYSLDEALKQFFKDLEGL